MSEIPVYVRWMIAGKWPEQVIQFVEMKKGDKGEEFYFMDNQGDCRCFPGKVKNLKDLVRKYGKDSEKWIGLNFMASFSKDEPPKIILTPV